MVYLLSILRTLLFFITMTAGSVLLHQALFRPDSIGQLTGLLGAGIFVVTPLYLGFDLTATRITKTKNPVSFLWPFLIALTIALFFAYAATRLA